MWEWISPLIKKKEKFMKKIAVPVTGDNQVDAHFGHCEYFKIYTISEDNIVLSVERMDSPEGCGCKSDIASVFEKEGVNIMLSGGIGTGAINVLNAHGIEVVRNCTGDVTELVSEYLSGKIADGGATCSEHHHEHECTNH